MTIYAMHLIHHAVTQWPYMPCILYTTQWHNDHICHASVYTTVCRMTYMTIYAMHLIHHAVYTDAPYMPCILYTTQWHNDHICHASYTPRSDTMTIYAMHLIHHAVTQWSLCRRTVCRYMVIVSPDSVQDDIHDLCVAGQWIRRWHACSLCHRTIVGRMACMIFVSPDNCRKDGMHDLCIFV